MSLARKYRRDTYRKMGLLKAKNGWGRFSEKGIAWYGLKQEEGRDFHEKHMRMVNDQIEEQLGSKLNSLKETWKGLNYSEKEIEMLEEAFTLTNIKNKETTASRSQELPPQCTTLQCPSIDFIKMLIGYHTAEITF